MDSKALTRLTGGSPLRTVVWLVVVSIVVGYVLETIGLDPLNFVRHLFGNLDRLIQHVVDLGFGAFTHLFRYLLWGAVVVVPIWLVMRLSGRGGR